MIISFQPQRLLAADTAGTTGAVTEGGLGGLLDGLSQAATEQTGGTTSADANLHEGNAVEQKPAAVPPTTPSAQAGEPESFPAYMAQLEGDLKANKTIGKYKSISELSRAYLELDGKLGAAIIPPGENATPEEKAAYIERLRGVKTPEDYKVNFPKDTTEETASDIKAMCFKLGLSNGQTQQFIDDISLRNQASQAAREQQAIQAKQSREQAIAQGQAALKQEWGDKYEQNLGFARRALTQESDPGLMRAIQDSGLSLNPAFVKYLARIGEATAEGRMVNGNLGRVDDGDHFTYPGVNS
jgi:hypothetical protein